MNTQTGIPNGRNDPLLLAGRILTVIMQGATALAMLAIAIALPAVLFFQDAINAELIADHGETISAFPAFPIAGILLVAAGIIALAFIFFGKLRRIINSVGDGEPFTHENANNLENMGWLALGVYLLSAVAFVIAASIEEWAEQIDDVSLDLALGFDLSSILMIIILFILARVFRHGAAMREDLEGTV